MAVGVAASRSNRLTLNKSGCTCVYSTALVCRAVSRTNVVRACPHPFWCMVVLSMLETLPYTCDYGLCPKPRRILRSSRPKP